MKSPTLFSTALLLGSAFLSPTLLPAQAAPDTLKACYVNGSGSVYRVGVDKAPAGCTRSSHVPFSWTRSSDGAAPPPAVVGGDLSGSLPAATVVGLQGRSVASTAPGNGQFLGWNQAESRWEPRSAPASGSGSIARVTVSGSGNNPSLALNFIGPTASVTLAGTQGVFVSTNKALGSTSANGGLGLNLYVCYRPTGGNIAVVGSGIANVQVPPNSRVLQRLSASFTLPPGSYEVGMCGFTNNSWSWNANDAGYTTALVFPPS